MTMAAQTQVVETSDDCQSSLDVPSLMARSRQATSIRTPTREKVSEAIALVRARQALEGRSSLTRVPDAAALKSIRSALVTKKTGMTASAIAKEGKADSALQHSKVDNSRSPLTPAGQMGVQPHRKRGHHHTKKVALQPSNFFQNVFASRSEVATSVQPDGDSISADSSMPDEPEENLPQSALSGFMNPIEFVKREIQLATQSASRGPMVSTKHQGKHDSRKSSSYSVAMSTKSSVPTSPSLDPEESMDSSDGPLDAKTVADISRFLDKLHIKPSMSTLNPAESLESFEVQVDAKTIQDVNAFLDQLSIKESRSIRSVLGNSISMDSDPIRAMRQTISDDFIYGSDYDDDNYSETSSNGSVNPETLAEIGAYIDAVSRENATNSSLAGSSVDRTLPGAYELLDAFSHHAADSVSAGTFAIGESEVGCNETTSVKIDLTEYVFNQDELEEEEINDQVTLDPSTDTEVLVEESTKSVTIDDVVQICYIDDELALIRSASSSGSSNAMAQTRTSKPSPIYEQVEAKCLPRGASKDPPAVVTSHNAARVDPPADINDNQMRMHDIEVVAPSYSAESLDLGITIPEHKQAIEEEKKAEEDSDERSWKEQAAKEPNLSDRPVDTNTTEGILALVVEAPSAENEDENSRRSEDLAVSVGGSEDYDAILREALGSPACTEEQSEADTNESDSARDVVSASSTSSVLLDDAGVPIRTHLSLADSDTDGDRKDSFSLGRYDTIEAERSISQDQQAVNEQENKLVHDEEENVSESSDALSALPSRTAIPKLPSSPSMKGDEGSLPWELKDIASEETMKAAGRTRAAVLNPASRSKARKLTSLLSDDTSVAQSTAMESNEGKRQENVDEIAESALAFEESADGASGAAVHPAKSASILEVGEDGNAGETTQSTLTFEEGEDGVEILEGGVVLENQKNEEESQGELEIEYCHVEERIMDIPPLPSGEEPTEDPSGRTMDEGKMAHVRPPLPSGEEPTEDPSGRTMDEDKMAHARPDPAGESNPRIGYVSEYDSTNDFVDAFLQHSSRSHTKECDAEEPKKQSGDHLKLDAKATSLRLQLGDRCGRVISSPAGDTDIPRPGFLEQYESLELEEDDSEPAQEGLSSDTDDGQSEIESTKSPVNLFTLPGITKYFGALGSKFKDESSAKAQEVKLFQRLIAPVLAGTEPSIIETAQIRQAALRAAIPMEVVDRFLDLVADERRIIPDVLSSRSADFSDRQYGDIEDLNDDEAITAFLTRFGTLHRGGHFPDANVGAVQDFVSGVAGSGEEEAVEIDAEFGFVNKKMAVEVHDDEEEEQEWWMEGQPGTKAANKVPQTESFGSTAVGASIGPDVVDEAPRRDEELNSTSPPLNPSSNSRALDSKVMRTFKEEPLMLNTRYAASHNFDCEDWARRKGMATYGAGWEAHANWLSPRPSSRHRKPQTIDGVEAAENIRRFVFSKKIFKNHHPWRRLYKERTQYHTGYYDVDVNSIYESTAINLPITLDEEDYIPWEHREVQQRFLHEKSYSFSRNWFGELIRKRGNQKIKFPVCKPKSMEMPIERVPDPGEWTKEWFTQWKSPAERRALRASQSDEDTMTDGSFTEGESLADNGSFTDNGTYTDNATLTEPDGTTNHGAETGSFTSTSRHDDDTTSMSGTLSERSYDESDGSASWEEAPECGEIVNVRQKIGERVTRVHPDYTSSLRRSRWRKKYFPRGTFPY